MFKIVVDVTCIRSKPSGIGIYTLNLINSLDNLQFKENFELGIVYQPSMKNWLNGNFSYPEILASYSKIYLFPIPVTISALLSNIPNPLINIFDKYLGNPDILHGTDNVVFPCRNSLKVMTIHDLTCIKYPQYINAIVTSYIYRIKQCLKWTDLILTVSESSKKDIIEYLNVKPEKIYVTPLASRYYPDYLSAEMTHQLEKQVKYDFSQPYLLFVSTIEPRKNITAIIYAFNYLKQKYKIEHNLILIGKKGWNYEPIFATLENSPWKHNIHHLDYLSDELVALFYSKADVFVYPSHYEGFGLPVLEAMTLGVPVVSSQTSSIPEVAGDAALLINPNEPIQLAEAILKVISDSCLRQQLIDKGKEQAKLFTWERTARETLKAYKSIIV